MKEKGKSRKKIKLEKRWILRKDGKRQRYRVNVKRLKIKRKYDKHKRAWVLKEREEEKVIKEGEKAYNYKNAKVYTTIDGGKKGKGKRKGSIFFAEVHFEELKVREEQYKDVLLRVFIRECTPYIPDKALKKLNLVFAYEDLEEFETAEKIFLNYYTWIVMYPSGYTEEGDGYEKTT